jgi:alpha-tubulin suppressor-like RCC1 family protein/endonuclease/exonuclease/phosphatase family metal-dependent hydrolase
VSGGARVRASLLCLAVALAVPAFGSISEASVPADERSAGRVRVAGMSEVAAGGEHSCGIRSAGTLWCWGRNNYGQIGRGKAGDGSEPPTQVGNRSDWARVAGGGASTCAIGTTQALFCWGLNHRGQIGDQTRTVRTSPTRVPGVNMWRSVSMGFFHTCAIRTNDTLWCWGDNSAGQIGKGNTKQSLKRFKVPGRWQTVSAGGWTTCATKVNGSLWCWGRNLFGQLGIGSYANRSKPARVGTAKNWKEVSVSWTHSCGRAGRTVRCWGRNTHGQLGAGDTKGSTKPRRIKGGHAAMALGVAEGSSCLVDTGRRLWCWGDNRYGQTGGKGHKKLSPRRRAGRYTSVSGGWLHLCAATSVSAACWGLNERGQLGDGKSVESRVPRISARTPSPRRGPYSFRLASFNVLGNGHTRPYAHDDRFGPSRMRAEWTAQALITGKIDVVGLQEPTAGQLAGILTAAKGRYAAFPGPERGDLAVETTILWDTRKYEAVRKKTILTQFIARKLPTPYVKLRHKATGRKFWVMNVHNAPWDYQKKRNQATRVQIAKIKELEQKGLPVFYVGDFNEKRTILCKVLRKTGLNSPAGGRINAQGQCVEPRQRMRVDWIFGSKFVKWSGFSYSRPPLVRLSTDHWVPVVNVEVP